MMKPESADDRKIFRIDNNEVTELLKLPDNQKYYSFNQLRPQVDEIEKQADRIEPIESSNRTVFESQLMKLVRDHEPVSTARSQPQTAGLGRFRGGTGRLPEKHRAGHRRRERPRRRPEIRPGRLQHPARFHGRLQHRRQLRPAPDHSARGPQPAARRLAEHRHQPHANRPHRRTQPGDKILCRNGHRLSFRAAGRFQPPVGEYRAWLADRFAPQVRKADQEFFFSTLEPFYKATVIYVLALVLALLSWFNLSDWLRRSAFYLVDSGVGHSHLRPRFPHVSRRPAAGDQSLFLRHLHRLGRGHPRNGSGKNLSRRHRLRRRGVRRLRHADHRAQPRARAATPWK